jgi:hypothetical protein
MKRQLYELKRVTPRLTVLQKAELKRTIALVREYGPTVAKLHVVMPEAREKIRDMRERYQGLIDLRSTYVVRRRDIPAAEASYIPLTGIPMKRALLKTMRGLIGSYRRSQKNRDADFMWSRAPGFYYEKFLSGIFEKEKFPQELVAYVGVELECFVPDRDELKKALLPWAKHLCLVHDGSIIAPSGFKSIEIRVLLLRTEIEAKLPSILAAIKGIGGGVNDTCGTHIHLDMRSASPTDLARSFKNLFLAQNVLFGMVPAKRRRNTYCGRTKIGSYERALAHGDRYKAINVMAFPKLGTFEIRLHHGSLEASELLPWIALCDYIMRGPAAEVVMRSRTRFGEFYGLPASLVSHIKATTARHSGELIASGVEEIPEPMENDVEAEAYTCGTCRRAEDECSCCSECGVDLDNCRCCSICTGDRENCDCCAECERTADFCSCSRCSHCNARTSDGCTCAIAEAPTTTGVTVLSSLSF